MARKHKPEDIIGKLREAEIVLAQGGTVADACRRIGVTEQSYYRWRKEYGGLKMDQARRMKELEKENARLRRAVSDLTLDKLQSILREVEDALDIGHTMVCVSDHGHFPARTIVGDLTADEVAQFCGKTDCRQCFKGSLRPLTEQAAQQPVVVVPMTTPMRAAP